MNSKMQPRSTDDDGYLGFTDTDYSQTGQQIGEPKLGKMTSGSGTYDHHKMQNLGAFFSKVPYDNEMTGAKNIAKAEKFCFVGSSYNKQGTRVPATRYIFTTL